MMKREIHDTAVVDKKLINRHSKNISLSVPAKTKVSKIWFKAFIECGEGVAKQNPVNIGIFKVTCFTNWV